jgi:hypothetical protein
MLLRIPEERITHSRHAETRTGRNRKDSPAKSGRICTHPASRIEELTTSGSGYRRKKPVLGQKIGFKNGL